MRAIKMEAIAKLHVAEINILVLLAERLGTDSKRIDYREFAEELGLSRNAVKYNVDKLISAGLVHVIGGKLSIAEEIFSELPEPSG